MRNKTSAVVAVAAIFLTIGALWFTNRTVAPRQATWDDVVAEAIAGGYRLITTADLAEKYRQDPDSLLLVDTRQEWEFRTGHLQGAVNFPMEPTAWSRWRKASALEALLGTDKERTVAFY
jgi:predicted sulfurtransferase